MVPLALALAEEEEEAAEVAKQAAVVQIRLAAGYVGIKIPGV
jgi:hypothetical protein